MQEFTDGTFGKVEPAAALLARLAVKGVPGTLKAVHFGEPADLQAIQKRLEKEAAAEKEREEVAERLRAVEARVNALAANEHNHGVRVYPADTPLPPAPHP